MKFKLLTLGFLSLCFALTSLTASAQCSAGDPNSHEIENATNQVISYKVWIADGSSPCGAVYKVSGTINACSAKCIIPNNSTDMVVAVEINANSTYYADGLACQIVPAGSTTAQPICTSGSLPVTISFNGPVAGTTFEP